MPDISDTQPRTISRQKKPIRWLAALVFIALIVLSLLGGYWSGVSDRLGAQASQVAPQVDQQFQLGVEALEQGMYELAIQHFQFVIEHNPGYPGIQEKYTEALLGLSLGAPTTQPIEPSASPTPDLRGVDAIFTSARERLILADWNGALETLDTLRKTDPAYRTVDVDGMYYIALRMRGYSKIYPTDCTQINLEGAIYDLTLAERFGPLDSYADGIRTWARYYLRGAAFWEVDWSQAVYYFGQIFSAVPNLMDSTCLTAVERYRYSVMRYAEALAAGGDYCTAEGYYVIALGFSSTENEAAFPTATFVNDMCISGGELPPPTGEAPPEATPTETPLPTETPTSTPGP
ncbi:MAG: hypothetical protein FJZ96_13225 [Chloroflexi bacterium]|nr:hypothetical protein [Chloroflexota bacterium]